MHENEVPLEVHNGIERLEDVIRRKVLSDENFGLRSENAPTMNWSYDEDEEPHRDPAYFPAYNPRRVSGASYRPYAGDSEWTLAANAAMKVAANANFLHA